METDATWRPRAPAPALRGMVEGYVGYRFHDGRPGFHRGLPSRHMTFIVSIGSPINVARQTNPAQAPGRYRALIGGLQASTALVTHDGTQEGVAISLSPLGSAALFGVPAAELWDLSAEVSSVLGRAGEELWERVQDAETWGARFEACDRVLLGWLGRVRIAESIAGAWRALVATDGKLSVSELAAYAGYSRQHFTRLFRRELGLGPKVAGRIVRFDHAVELLRRTAPRPSLADIAVACGFTDQAHLCRDVADLAGCTPGELAAGDIPIIPPELFHSSTTAGAG